MEDRNVIIKKVKKRKGHDSHGGSWKVAYADFVTAMMAFFLLLWLITMVSPDKKLSVSEYFKNFNIMKEETAGSQGILDKQRGLIGEKQGAIRIGPQEHIGKSKQDIAGRLKQAVDEKLHNYRDQIYIDIVEDGVRIQVVDTEGSVMFALGSAEPTERAKQIIGIIAENTRDLPNKVAIEGHTDAAPFRGSQTTNWELSTSRASAARREMEKNGTDPMRIARVVGYADQELYDRDNPRDPKNRRISITVITKPGQPAPSITSITQTPTPVPSPR
ncbi:MAG: flagellar motor protein MotB [Pseudomonadota bacterium]|nr:flagellar motor protein MotB [Pseudomonadota bacterium]